MKLGFEFNFDSKAYVFFHNLWLCYFVVTVFGSVYVYKSHLIHTAILWSKQAVYYVEIKANSMKALEEKYFYLVSKKTDSITSTLWRTKH